MRILQVTLGAAATPITTDADLYASIIAFQSSAAAVIRIGDNTVSATKGIVLAAGTPGGSATFQMAFPRGTHLIDWYAFGTAGQVIDILYEQST